MVLRDPEALEGGEANLPDSRGLTELRVVGPSYVFDYENETRVPVASNPPAWVVLHPAEQGLPSRTGIGVLDLSNGPLLLSPLPVPSSSWASMRSL